MKALLIGINYKGTKNELRGCINDVHHMKDFLNTNYSNVEMKILEEAKGLEILEGIRWLTKDVNASSELFFHYSGHGGSIRDRNSDEADGNDECIFPLDGYIIDDDLKRLMIEPLPKGAKLTCIFDCCHSGTVLDLRYNCKIETSKKECKYILTEDRHYKKTKADVILLSGCRDDQYSADAWEEGQSQGAMTYSFLKSWKAGITYSSLIKNLQKFIKRRGYQQVPQMSLGRMIALSEKFSIFSV